MSDHPSPPTRIAVNSVLHSDEFKGGMIVAIAAPPLMVVNSRSCVKKWVI